ncbi:hypothetical protein Tco_0394926 [Tanacetum coccineum]
MDEGEIDNLTMKQYLALTRGNQAPDVVKPQIAGNHMERILDIVSLFNISRVTHDEVMLRVFPITLTGAAKRWVDRLYPRTVNSWDLLKKAFIQKTCTPSNTAKKLEEIRNFKQAGDEMLYQAWERYNDLLYKFLAHDINSHQKTMANHSQKWHDGSSSRNINSSSNSEGIDSIVRCKTRRGAHLDKECPLNEEVKSMEEVKYGEFGRPFTNNSRIGGRFNRGVSGYGSQDPLSSGERRPSLTEIINKYMEEAAKRHEEQDE